MKRLLSSVGFILAAAGSAGAQGAEGVAARVDDIDFWTTSYSGADLTSGKYDCQAPAIPAVSKTNDDITATARAIAAWEACYNGFVDNMNDAMPIGKRIPADVRARMSDEQFERARAHLEYVYGKVVARVQDGASAVMARRDAWRSETDKYVAEQNRLAAARGAAERMKQEADTRQMDHFRSLRNIALSPGR